MAEWPDPRIAPNNAGVTVDGRAIGSAAIDQGLRSHMLKVYNYMASAVLLTGIIALVFAQSGLALQVLSTPLRYVLMFAPLAFIFLIGARAHKMTTGGLQVAFWAFATVMGLSMSSIFLVFSGESIARTFFHHRSSLPVAQPVGLYHQERPDRLGQLSDHGRCRAFARDGCESVSGFIDHANGDQCAGRADLCWPDGV